MSGYIIHFDNETDLVHYGIKGMKWRKGKKSLKPEKRLHGIERRTAVNRRVRAFEKKNLDMYKAQPKKGLYSAKERKVGSARISDWGRMGVSESFKSVSKDGGKTWTNKYKGNSIDRAAAKKIVAKTNKKRYKAQRSTIQKGADKVKKWFKSLF